MDDNDIEAADRAVEELIERFARDDVCPCCCARAMLFRSVNLMIGIVGRPATAEVLESVIADLEAAVH
jgi:hypothetical protein